MVLTFLLGCTSKASEEVKVHYRKTATQFAAEGKHSEALTEYRHLADLDPHDDETQYQMALLHEKLGSPADIESAHRALLTVVKLNPARFDARLKLAWMYLHMGLAKRARFYAEGVLALEPANADAHLIKGLSLVQDGVVQEGLLELQRAIDTDPNRMVSRLELARTYARRGDYSAAESVLRDALRVMPASLEARLALGDVLQSERKSAEAEEEYRRALEIEPKSGDVYLRLALLKQRQKRRDEAENVYRRWIEAVPNDVRAHLALGQFYQSIGRPNEALLRYQQAVEADPSSVVAQEALITSYLESKRLGEAGVKISALMNDRPSDIGPKVLQARLKFDSGEEAEALALLQALAHQEPRSAGMQEYLGIVLARMGRLAEAISALKEANRLAPESGEVLSSLAQTQLIEGSIHSAIKNAEQALEYNPLNVPVLKILAEAHLQAGNTKRAQQVLEELSIMVPSDPLIHHRLGIVLRIRKQDNDALAHFERALEANPSFVEALDQVTGILVSQGHVRKARERVARQIVFYPTDARLYNLMGRLWVVSHDDRQAEAAFKKAMSLDDRIPESYMNLGSLYIREGRTQDGIEEFEAVLAKEPRHVPVLMALGMLHEHRKERSQAEERYQQVLQVDPTFALAANNLAWLLVERGDGVDRALSYAQRARQARPHDPHIADTLGWVYFHKKMYGQAVGLLKEAIEQLPEQSLTHYHYGMAQFRNNNLTEAKKSFTKFLVLSPRDERASEVRDLLSTLS